MNQIRESRIQKGYTQIELARLIGVDRSAISRWENGDNIPRLNRLVVLSQTLDVDINILFNNLVQK